MNIIEGTGELERRMMTRGDSDIDSLSGMLAASECACGTVLFCSSSKEDKKTKEKKPVVCVEASL